MDSKSSQISNLQEKEKIEINSPFKAIHQVNTKAINKPNNGNTLDNYFVSLTKMKRTRPDSEEHNSQTNEENKAQDKYNRFRIKFNKNRN